MNLLREIVKDSKKKGATDLEIIQEVLNALKEEGVCVEQGETKKTEIFLNKFSSEPLEEQISNLFLEFGIPAHIKGYHYLREAIRLAIEKPTVLEAITKELYPLVAEKFYTTPSRVERAIRHSIEVAWQRGNWEAMQKFFGYTPDPNKGKPTNSEFVALIADKLKRQNR